MPALRYAPPAVVYPVQPNVWAGWGAQALWGMGGLGLVVWWWASGPQPLWRAVAAALLWLAAGAVYRRVQGEAGWGELAWDGGAWSWQGQGSGPAVPLLRVDIVWDGGSVVWVALHPQQGRVRWAWLRASAAAWRWGDCRRALYSTASSRIADERP